MNKAILLEDQVFWSGLTFKEVINEYRRYTSLKYKIYPIVFDGYKSKTTKDHEYARCEAYNSPCADVLADENVTVLHCREKFLWNSNNKQQLIKFLAKHFTVKDHTVIDCKDNTDTQIFPAKSKRWLLLLMT